MLKKVISGGQTGVDQIGIEIARECGIETGGTAPKNYRTERGSNFKLKEFGLKEHLSSRYEPRTEENIINSDGTVLFGNMASSGSITTKKFLIQHKKPYISNPTPSALKEFILCEYIDTLNVAGNRESLLTYNEIDLYKQILRETFKMLLK